MRWWRAKAARSVVFPEPRGDQADELALAPCCRLGYPPLERLQLEPDPLAERPELHGVRVARRGWAGVSVGDASPGSVALAAAALPRPPAHATREGAPVVVGVQLVSPANQLLADLPSNVGVKAGNHRLPARRACRERDVWTRHVDDADPDRGGSSRASGARSSRRSPTRSWQPLRSCAPACRAGARASRRRSSPTRASRARRPPPPSG
jgi:hypothetical protein